jgi:mitochondrial fission protein ELM1
MIAYVLMSKHHGNNNQLLALAENFPQVDKVITINCDLRSRSKFFRCSARIGLFFKKRVNLPFLHCVINALLLTNTKYQIENSIFFAKTGPFELPLLLITVGNNARSVFVGDPVRTTASDFDYIISTPSTFSEKANISLEVLPSKLTYRVYKQSQLQRCVNKSREYWCFLIGGDATGYQYSEECIKNLVSTMVSLALQYRVKWIISTSPRTGKVIENLLLNLLQPNLNCIEKMGLWLTGDKVKIVDALSYSSVVFVFEDSVSMLSEAINVRLPVISIRPNSTLPVNSLVTPFVEYHSLKSRIKRLSVEELGSFDINKWVSQEHIPLDKCWAEQLEEQL